MCEFEVSLGEKAVTFDSEELGRQVASLQMTYLVKGTVTQHDIDEAISSLQQSPVAVDAINAAIRQLTLL